MSADNLEESRNDNPYSPISIQAGLDREVASKPVFGPILMVVTTVSLAGFLIYLLFTSPPDRRIATVLFAHVPCLVAYAWILRYRPGYNLFALMCVFAYFGLVYLFLVDLFGADREPLRVFYAILTTPILIGGGWTLVSYRGRY
ncbi:MAG: hypothetical protein ACK5PB_23735 [Pirellula sp.]